ncbi:MAG: hypothetical protein M3O50_21575 [Myxococcota bacterium]|nr:hypothetical protein [Myxococcota bacterium]
MSVLVRTITVVVQDVGIQFQLRVGNLDPHDEHSGLLSRLRQLDYLGNEGEHVAARPWLAEYADEANAHTIRKGIQAFQYANGDDVTGEVDDDVCGGIRDKHGC